VKLLSKLLGRSAQDGVTWIEASELLTLLETAPPLIVDVRRPDEFTGPLGHITSAQNVPLDELAGRAADLLREERPLVLVCHTDRRSSAAADHLRRAGGRDVSVLRGGMVAWRLMP
jgi:rhodanese-related sulfurtransferase